LDDGGRISDFSFLCHEFGLDLSSLQLNGNANTLNTLNGVRLQLTLAKPDQMGSVFTKNKSNIGEGFSTFFTFRITTPSNGDAASADGLGFVVQSVSSDDVGKPADDIVKKGVEVEFSLIVSSYVCLGRSYVLQISRTGFLPRQA
jgi:hypothetical protein